MLRRALFPASVCIAGIFATFHPTLLSGFSRLQTDIGDPRLNNYLLEHAWLWITGRLTHPFWDPTFYFPARNVLAYGDVLLGAAPIYWVWRVFGAMPDTAYQLWSMSIAALNFVAFNWLLRRDFGVGRLAAVAGAYVFAFGGPRLAQLAHIQLFPQFFTVLLVHALIRIFAEERCERPARMWALAFGSLTLQLYAGYYLGWFAAFGVLLALGAAVASSSGRARLRAIARRDRTPILVSASASMVALLPMGFHYVQAGREVGLRGFGSAISMLPRLPSWLTGDAGSWFYRWTLDVPPFSRLPMRHEHGLTFGILTLVVALFGLRSSWRNPIVRVLGVVGLLAAVLASWFPGGMTLWGGVFWIVPGARALRAVTRIVLLIAIPISVGVAYGISRLQEARGPVLAGLLALACGLEQLHTTPSYDKLEVRARVARLVGQVRPDCEAFLVTPHRREPVQIDWFQLDAMWASLQNGVPTLNGYSGNGPPGWPFHEAVMDSPAEEEKIGKSLDAWSETHGLERGRVCWVKEVE